MLREHLAHNLKEMDKHNEGKILSMRTSLIARN